MASISSMKMMDGEFSLASLKLFPINLLYITVSDESTSYKKIEQNLEWNTHTVRMKIIIQEFTNKEAIKKIRADS